MAPTDSSSSDGDASSPPTSETAASLASIAENLQRSAIQSARTMQQNSSTHFRTFQVSSSSSHFSPYLYASPSVWILYIL
ncbi:hypothetical protein SESBI_34597 [Sesbania bispinosa]|nr:hypothetical protein SESBI_34597 [Sesbania bispinosa]